MDLALRWRRLEPTSAQVLADLCPAVGSVTGYDCAPGPERYGTLVLGTVARSDVRDLLHAVVVLWKMTACLQEEWPYEPWSAERVRGLPAASYTEDWERWREPPEGRRTPQQRIDSLRSLARGVLNAPRPWLNEPVSYPPGGFDLGLLTLDFVCTDLLKLTISDRWNDMAAVFADPQRLYWIGWATSA